MQVPWKGHESSQESERHIGQATHTAETNEKTKTILQYDDSTLLPRCLGLLFACQCRLHQYITHSHPIISITAGGYKESWQAAGFLSAGQIQIATRVKLIVLIMRLLLMLKLH